MIRFVGPSYTLNTREADVQRAVNLFPVFNEAPGGKSVAYLDQIPGLQVFSAPAVELSYLLLHQGGYVLLNDGGGLLLQGI